MRYNFCTLFDKNYLTRGLALYSSLRQQAGDFHLWILCMDETVYDILSRLDLTNVSLIQLTELEDPALLKIKPSRTPVEYCWTLTPSLPLYILEHHPELDTITYLDADTFFFSSPQPIYDEFTGHSVLIVKHNYSPRYQDKEKTSGVYNVELLIFKNDQTGKAVLRWWRERCIEWCFFRYEDGKLGDQLYLNDWPERFDKVRVLEHIGGGVAPWNIDQYQVTQRNQQVLVNNKPVIFYHYHAFRWYTERLYEPSAGYSFPPLVRRLIYQPYQQALQQALQQVRSVTPKFNFGFHPKDESFRGPCRQLFRFVQRYQFALYLLGSALFLMALNHWIWPTSDEFLYAILADMFGAAARGEVAWQDINTEHTWLVSALSFLYNWVAHPQSMVASRAVILPFALGVIVLLYKIPKVIGLDSKYQMWWLWLLLLIPGFWLFSVRLMLDIPSTFGLILLLYLLLKRAPVYQISLALLLILMIKEYYIYLTLPLIMVVFALDAWFSQTKKWWQKLLLFISSGIIAYFPTFIMTVILLDFDWLPFPRVLETSLERIFGDLFTLANRTCLSLLQRVFDLFLQAGHQVAVSPVTTPPVADVTNTAANVATTGTQAGAGIVTNVVPTTSALNSLSNVASNPTVTAQLPDFSSKISSLTTDGWIPKGSYVSPSLVHYTFLQKLWLMYKYNLSETDINIFILPLVAIGAAIRLKVFKWPWKERYLAMRTDIIFFLFLLIFLYFNYYQAPEMHGFRITIPIIVSLLYFSFYGLRSLLENFSKQRILWFIGLSIGAITLYLVTIEEVVYGSILAHIGFVEALLIYKPYIFTTLFILLAVLIIFFSKIKQPWKYRGLIVLVIGLFTIKYLPFYIDDRLETQTYGKEYGLADATPILVSASRHIAHIYTNTHPYRLQYYANDFRYSNTGFTPIVRRFESTYPVLYFRFPLDQDFFYNVQADQIQFVFLVNDTYDESDMAAFENIRQQYPNSFIKLAEHFNSNGRLQWVLYEIGWLPEQP